VIRLNRVLFLMAVTVVLAPSPAAGKGSADIAAPPAPVGQLTEVTGFGANPTNLQMFVYVPPVLRAHPSVLVALHYCTGSGPAMFDGTDYASLADRYGFVVVYPSASREGHCFDVSSPAALRHDGASDPVGIVSMVRYVQDTYRADRNRVYVTGISSGAMMTNVLLGDYPDVFAAGSAFMGVPFGCFATTDGSMWNSTCAHGDLVKTPEEWGDLVRAASPDHHGPRPRMQLWHGVLDDILFYPNFGEEIKQWTNVLHAGLEPSFTDHPRPTWTHTQHTDVAGKVQVDAYSIADAGHSLGFRGTGMAEIVIAFFGLDRHGPVG